MSAMPASALALVTGCASAAPAPPTPAKTHEDTQPWRVPDGWKHEIIPFPLGFAPELAHRGLEELRFPPGFLDESAANRWSYVFVWRLDDPATLDAAQLGDELVVYFRGLLAAVDGDKQRLDPAQITASATREGDHFALTAHVIDTFRSAGPVDLVGTARRTTCGTGSLWTFVLAPSASPIRAELDALAAEAHCAQKPWAAAEGASRANP